MQHMHEPWLARQFQRCPDHGLWRVCLEDGADIVSVVIVMARVNQSNDLIAGLTVIAIFWSRTVGGVFYGNYKV